MNPGHYGDQSYEQIRCWNVPPYEDQQGNNFIQPGATCSGGIIFHLPLYQTNYEDIDVAAQDPEVPLKPKAKAKLIMLLIIRVQTLQAFNAIYGAHFLCAPYIS